MPSANWPPMAAWYSIGHGPLFFGSSNDLIERFEYGQDPTKVIIDLTHAQIWDTSSVAALDAIVTKYQAHSAEVTINPS